MIPYHATVPGTVLVPVLYIHGNSQAHSFFIHNFTHNSQHDEQVAWLSRHDSLFSFIRTALRTDWCGYRLPVPGGTRYWYQVPAGSK
jgi:hypothetical protein